MTHTIKKTLYQSAILTTTPTKIYEANFQSLLRLMPKTDWHVNDIFVLAQANISITILQQYKYTTILSLKKLLLADIDCHSKSMTNLSAIDMELRVCHDACLVEVIAYQGKSTIRSLYPYPNKLMLQIDEKRQLNLFLKDVLENALKIKKH